MSTIGREAPAILLLSEVFPPMTGGSGRWLFEVYRRITQDNLTVLAGEHPQAADFDRRQSLRVRRAPLVFDSWGCFDARGFRQYWQTYRRVRIAIRDFDLGVVHCARVLPEGWVAWMLRMRSRIPYWVFVHGEELIICRKSRQMTWMARQVFAKAEGIIANSQNTARLLSADWGIPSTSCHVIHPGVDTGRFVVRAVDHDQRKTLGWGDRKVLLTVGRLEKRKGHDVLIRALSQIRRHVPDVLYAIVGDGVERQSLESLAQREGVAECVQFLDEMADERLLSCYQQCDLFVLPNREVHGDFEGFGMVLVEAQACGKPVVAGASGGTEETMDIPHTGVRVNCDRPEPLADVVTSLLLDEPRRKEMGHAAREWTVTHFDWTPLSRQVAKTLSLPLPESHQAT